MWQKADNVFETLELYYIKNGRKMLQKELTAMLLMFLQ